MDPHIYFFPGLKNNLELQVAHHRSKKRHTSPQRRQRRDKEEAPRPVVLPIKTPFDAVKFDNYGKASGMPPSPFTQQQAAHSSLSLCSSLDSRGVALCTLENYCRICIRKEEENGRELLMLSPPTETVRNNRLCELCDVEAAERGALSAEERSVMNSLTLAFVEGEAELAV